MDGRIIFAAGIGFLSGAAISAGITYIYTKRKCDEKTQLAIDEMDAYYKERERKNVTSEKEQEKEEKGEDFVHVDKPSIEEMSSIINSDVDNDSRRTHYSMAANKKGYNELKERLRNEVEDNKSSILSVVTYDIYNELLADEYEEMEFTFNVDEEAWHDWHSEAEYDIQDLPFDPGIVQWNENEQCYICDKESKTVYVLEKV